MKKSLLFALAAAFAVSANAQFTSGGATNESQQAQRGSLADQMRNGKSQSFNYSEPSTYSGRFNLGYNMWSTLPSQGDGTSYNGFYVEWLDAVSLSANLPLYFDWGFNVNYNHYSKDENKIKSTSNLFQMAVPLQVEYRLPVGDSFHVSPFLGLIARVNILGNGSSEYEETKYSSTTGKKTGTSTKKQDINYFDKNDMKSSEACWKRFQLGWNIGVNFDINKFTIGLSYGTDFMEISKKCNSSTFKVGIGVNY